MTSPAHGSTHTVGATLTIAANASDADGIAHVDLFADSVLLGRVTTSPFSRTWSSSVAGTHRFVAIATDTRGASTTSSPVDVTLQPAACTTLAAPVFSPAAGTYSGNVSVTLSTSSSGAVVRFTLDGSDPTASSAQYTQALSLASTTTVRARTFGTGCASPSAVTSATYQVIPVVNCGSVAVPTLSPASGTYVGSVNVSLATSTAGGVVRYTTDGTDPHSGSPEYTAPLAIAATTTVRARTFLSTCSPSAAASGTYQITPAQTAPTPTFSPAPGAQPLNASITIATADPFATIRYTTDGTEPTESSSLYSGPMTLTGPLNLKAKAYRSGYGPSATAAAVYAPQLPVPTVTPASGDYGTRRPPRRCRHRGW
jgi:N-acetyl-beta-hexosaminidase